MKLTNRKCFVVSNTSFSLENFRSELISALSQDDLELYLIAESPKAEMKDLGQNGFVNIRYPRHYFAIFILIKYIILSLIHLFRIKPDIVLTFTIIPNIVFCALRFLIRFKLICNITGFGRLADSKSIFEKFLFKSYLFLLRKADYVFCQNDQDFEMVLCYRKHNVFALPGSGIDLDKVQSQPIIDDRKKILFLGRLIPEKGINHFLDCCEKFPELQFVVVGFLEFSSKAVIERLKSMDKVKNLQFVPGTSDPLNYIAEASFVCLPSIYREGTPRVLIEALAIGRAIITTDRPGCRACVKDGYNGYMLSADSLGNSLSNTMRRINNVSREEIILFGRNSRQLSSSFDVKQIINTYFRAIEGN